MRDSTTVSTTSLRVVRSPVDLQNAGYPRTEQVFGHFQPDPAHPETTSRGRYLPGPIGIDLARGRSAAATGRSLGVSATGQALHGDLDDVVTIRWYAFQVCWPASAGNRNSP